MTVYSLTVDQDTGERDIPNGWEMCDGDCFEVHPESQLTQVGDRLYCTDCIPESEEL